jgi:hypothetical protein
MMNLTDHELQAALAEVGRGLDWPPEPDISVTVGERLRRESPARPPSWFRGPRRRMVRPIRSRPPAWRLVAAAIVAAVVLFSAVLAVSPGARKAVAGWFGLRGVEIQQTKEPPRAPTRRIGEGFDLGRRVTIPQAEHAAGLTVRVPAALGPPDAVFVNPLSVGDGEVFLLYRPRPGLPESAQTGAGALLSEFRGDIDRAFMKKVALSTQTRFVRVNGNPGFWIRGSHDIAYLDRHGDPVQGTLRLSGSVLLWEQDGLTFRLESALSLDQALAVARTLR